MEPPATTKSLQHALNDPIAGLLAELHLLEMHDVTPDQRAGVQRSVTIVRRLIAVEEEQVPNA
jgi:hypothetical protein